MFETLPRSRLFRDLYNSVLQDVEVVQNAVHVKEACAKGSIMSHGHNT